MQALVAIAAKARQIFEGVVAGVLVPVVDHLGGPAAVGAKGVLPKLLLPELPPPLAVATAGRAPPPLVKGPATLDLGLLDQGQVLGAKAAGLAGELPAAWFAARFRRSWRHALSRFQN